MATSALSGMRSSSATITWSPPRLSVARRRACSTRIQRIALAEAAKKWLRSTTDSGVPRLMRRNSSCTSTVGVIVASLPSIRELASRRSSGYSASNTAPSWPGCPSRASASSRVMSGSSGMRTTLAAGHPGGKRTAPELRVPSLHPGIAHGGDGGDVVGCLDAVDLRLQDRTELVLDRTDLLLHQVAVRGHGLFALAEADVRVTEFDRAVDAAGRVHHRFFQPGRDQRPVRAFVLVDVIHHHRHHAGGPGARTH